MCVDYVIKQPFCAGVLFWSQAKQTVTVKKRLAGDILWEFYLEHLPRSDSFRVPTTLGHPPVSNKSLILSRPDKDPVATRSAASCLDAPEEKQKEGTG